MKKNLTARASTRVEAPISDVWAALVTPETIKRYMFGTTVESDWKVGHPIRWKGEWKGKPYEDKGVLVAVEPEQKLAYTHYSPLAGEPDVPESYHNVTITLAPSGNAVVVTLTQDGNASEEAREHSEKNWAAMLDGLKRELTGAPAADAGGG